MEKITLKTSLKRLVRTKITDGPHVSPDLVEEGIPFVSAEGVVEGKIDFTKKRGNITKVAHDFFCQKVKPQFGDLFIVKSGSTTGKIAIVETYDEFSIWSPLALVRTNDLILNRLLYYILQSSLFQLQIQQYWSFGTQPNIGMNKIEQLQVEFPKSKEHQNRIVNYLDIQSEKINHFIQKKQGFIELLKEQRQSIINHAVTKGIDGNLKMKSSGVAWLGDVPEKWELRKLKFCVILNSNEIVTDDINKDTFKIALENIDNWTGKFIETGNSIFEGIGKPFNTGDVLFNKLRPYLAKAFIADKEGYCVSELLVLTPIKYIISKEYLFQRLMTPDFINIVNSSTYGAKMPRANWSFIGNLKISLPNINEQNQIVEFIKIETQTIDTAITKAEKEIELIKEYKEAMISEAVMGKIKIN